MDDGQKATISNLIELQKRPMNRVRTEEWMVIALTCLLAAELERIEKRERDRT